MNYDVFVSIIIPVYNAEKYLDQCIKSILIQTYSYFELILVDDGSSDHSSSICDDYALKDNRIKVIHQENRGVAGARNTGILLATGEYVAFVDADDWWSNDFLEVMISVHEKNNMAICEIVKVMKDGKKKLDPKFDCDMKEWCWPIINNYSISCYRCLFNRKIVIDNKLLFTTGRKAGEDQEFTYKYMIHIQDVVFVPKAKYYYRINNDSAMFQENYNHFHAIEAMLAVEQYAKENCDEKRYMLISNAVRFYKCPYILEFAILTILTEGAKPATVLRYLNKKGYDSLLNLACSTDKHYRSDFIDKWKTSPNRCLNYYYFRRRVGSVLRRMKVKK